MRRRPWPASSRLRGVSSRRCSRRGGLRRVPQLADSQHDSHGRRVRDIAVGQLLPGQCDGCPRARCADQPSRQLEESLSADRRWRLRRPGPARGESFCRRRQRPGRQWLRGHGGQRRSPGQPPSGRFLRGRPGPQPQLCDREDLRHPHGRCGAHAQLLRTAREIQLFHGMLERGKNASVAASNFADYFDGIIGGDGVWGHASDHVGGSDMPGLTSKWAQTVQLGSITPAQGAALQAAVVQACDGLDGLRGRASSATCRRATSRRSSTACAAQGLRTGHA